MRQILTTGQRVVLLVGLAMMVVVVISDIRYRAYGGQLPALGPLQSTSTYFAVVRPSPVRTVLLPGLVVAAWTAFGVYLFRRPSSQAV